MIPSTRSTRSLRLRCTLLLVACSALPGAAEAQEIDTLLLERHARALAHDSLGGRANGTPGQRGAAAYIERELERLRLKPAGDGRTFRQRIPLVRVDVDRGRTQLVLRRGSSQQSFAADVVAHFGGDSAVFRAFRGDAVYGGSAAEALSA